MKTLYLDHNILVNEGNWDSLRRVVADGTVRLAASSWNIVEIEQGEDSDQMLRRAEFIAALQPLFIHDMLTLQRYEIRNFLWLYFFKSGIFPFNAFSPSYAAALFEDLQIKVREDYSLVDYFRAAMRNDRRNGFATIDQQKDALVEALRTLQNADREKLKAIDEQVFFHHLAALLPRYRPNGKAIGPQTWAEMLQFCNERKVELYRLSPALFAENELGNKRRQDVRRQPNRGDAADLMHATLGLAYCDYFVTNDGFVVSCAEFARGKLDTQGVAVAEIFRSLQAFCERE